jgi:hypothetical protein
MRYLPPLLLLLLAHIPAHAMDSGIDGIDAGIDGYADIRLVTPTGERSWLEGGLGKLRYGEGDANFQFAELAAQGHVLITPELSAVVLLRVSPYQRTPVDVLESYVRYRPVSTTPWRWSVTVGAFFPPISLENTEIGWTSYWTLTPSAINSWVGDELRTIGGEGKLEWRRDSGTIALTGAALGWNDPAGVMIADRGWTLDDHPTGLFDHLRLPDATAALFGETPPAYTPIFEEIDNRVGWYGELSWDQAGVGHFEALRYDNSGNSSDNYDGVSAWHTDFWSAGYKTQFGAFTLLAQGLTGETIITPFAHFGSVTDYDSAYVLLGWEHDNWRFAARAELFGTRERNPGPDLPLSENGHAFTAAASWLPYDWLRLTGEEIYIDSTRDERAIVGLAPNKAGTQFQLSSRFYF